MKSKIWPRWPRKWPLDLNDLGRGWVDFFKNHIFKISALSWEKWAIARFSSKTYKISNLCYFLAASEYKELKNCICKGVPFHPVVVVALGKNVLFDSVLQGPRTQIDAFQTNIFPWLNDILIKRKIFLESWDGEIWYKTLNLGIFIISWSQFLHTWKDQQVFCLIFTAIKGKTNWHRRKLQPFSRFWKNQS